MSQKGKFRVLVDCAITSYENRDILKNRQKHFMDIRVQGFQDYERIVRNILGIYEFRVLRLYNYRLSNSKI
jgi:hypothetical protein